MDPIFTHLLTALLGGLVTSLIAPFIKWDIEKRKQLRQRRAEKIAFWRSEIEAHTDFRKFVDTTTFNDIRHRFSKDELERFPAIWSAQYGERDEHWERGKFLKAHSIVNSIEKEWGLI